MKSAALLSLVCAACAVLLAASVRDAAYANTEPERSGAACLAATTTGLASSTAFTTALSTTGHISVSPSYADFIGVSDPSGAPILRVGPLPTEPRDGQAPDAFSRFAPPESPQEVTVELWTKDGRRWKAEWKEEK